MKITRDIVKANSINFRSNVKLFIFQLFSVNRITDIAIEKVSKSLEILTQLTDLTLYIS
jgi:hypothetical protein